MTQTNRFPRKLFLKAYSQKLLDTAIISKIHTLKLMIMQQLPRDCISLNISKKYIFFQKEAELLRQEHISVKDKMDF